jgi:hypothetical protein
MLNWLKNKLKGNKEESEDTYSFRWYEIGEAENPFNKRILDIRSFTQTVISTTSKFEVVGLFNSSRASVGENHRGAKIPNETKTEASLVYPHNGEKLEGIIFKSAEMECKWDIYIYDDCFYFVRNWSDELFFKAFAEISDKEIIVNKIHYSNGKHSADEAINAVHFLMKSHAFGQPFPHQIPNVFSDEEKMAHFSFTLYGNRACYATFEDITDTTIKLNE